MEERSCLKVPKRLGARGIFVARALKLQDKRLIVRKEDDFVIIPLSRDPKAEDLTVLRGKLQNVVITTYRFKEKRQNETLYEVIASVVPAQLLTKIPRSMDIIGHVAIIEVPSELGDYKNQLGKAILKVNKSIKTVLAKVSAIGGKYRLRKYERLAGIKETKTIHREHGCVYHLDPRKVYFSPRLSQEHWRVTKKVKTDEVIIDMFAGVGPFSIQIAKRHSSVKVYAIDINPSAIRFLKQNIIANKVNNVTPILGDARETIVSDLASKADRIIMNMPERAIEFIDIACRALQDSKRGVIHYYGFESEPNALEKGRKKVESAISDAGWTVEGVNECRLVRSIAPHEWQVAVDVLVS